MKLCPGCQQRKEETDFGKNRARKDGLQAHCRDCTREMQHRWYERHKSTHYDYVQQQRKVNSEATVRKILDYLQTHPCVDCGETDPIVLEFDHVRGSKKFTIGSQVRLGYAWDTIRVEIEKCEVRCGNCHKRKTAKQYGYTRALLMGLLETEN